VNIHPKTCQVFVPGNVEQESAMRLTQWTDYALRVLMYCATHEQRDAAPTIAEIAEAHGISRSHLMKVVMELSAKGWLSTTRGRGGGLRLMQPASQIVVGEVVRQMEEDFRLVECFNPDSNTCRIDGLCRLKGTLHQALQAYMQVLDGVRLADLVTPGTGVSVVPLTKVKRARSSANA
jgi:Rrf2 family transcriptional regulator, nitric oxide-sensitive transcriptional repressor